VDEKLWTEMNLPFETDLSGLSEVDMSNLGMLLLGFSMVGERREWVLVRVFLEFLVFLEF
jgi:hypothetical protein